MIQDYLYGAYGSNLNQDQMARRCPDAKPMGNFALENFRLVFRSVADIEEHKGSECMIGLWRISKRDLLSLDRYEGYPSLYTKIYQNTPHGLVMLYQMKDRQYVHPPIDAYLTCISDGFTDFQLDHTKLKDAVMDSYELQTC